MSVYRHLADEELVLLLNEGDRDAFSEIYERYKGLLYVHAYKKLGDADEASDVVHDIFAALWERHVTLHLSGQLSIYLYTAVRNRVFKVVAKRKHSDKFIASIITSVESGYCVTDHLVRERMLAEIIEKELKALPPKMREVFAMSRNSGLSHKEIAKQLEISNETVRKHIHHALRVLRMKLSIILYFYIIFQLPAAARKLMFNLSSTQYYFSNNFYPPKPDQGSMIV